MSDFIFSDIFLIWIEAIIPFIIGIKDKTVLNVSKLKADLKVCQFDHDTTLNHCKLQATINTRND